MSAKNLSSNLTSLLFNGTTSNETALLLPSLEQLLGQMGFAHWQAIVQTFILPPLNLLGIGFCLFSLGIFLRPSFVDPIFFYFKLLCIVNVIHLVHNLPSCILLSPFYFPWSNSYFIAAFQIYYAALAILLYHFEDVLHLAILLTRMKLFSAFVKKHFCTSPQIVSVSLFLTCLVIWLPLPFSVKIITFGDYFYLTSNRVKQMGTLYIFIASEFSQTLFGRILLAFTALFLNLILSIVVGITLNISSYVKYKIHIGKKKSELVELQLSSIHNRPTTSREVEQLEQREKTERQIEKNMLYLALTLSSVSVLTRFIFMIAYVYYYIFASISNFLIFQLITRSIYTLVPTISIFVFYSFNKMFRDETNRILKRQR